MVVRAIRGATTVEENNTSAIIEATKQLLIQVAETNSIKIENIISIIFTTTNDLNSVYPAAAARQIGWKYVPVMCASEINVPGSLEKCIRIMVHAYVDKDPEQINHIYLNKAVSLRPDLNEDN